MNAEAIKPRGEIIYGMPREQYDRLERVNWSTLKHIGKSPAHYRYAVGEAEFPDSPALKLGRALHVHVYEPERVKARLAVWDGKVRNGKKWNAFCEKNEGRDILSKLEDIGVRAMATAVRGHSAARKYIEGGKSEVTLLWTHTVPAIGGLPGYEVEMKARLDFVADVGAIVDLKSSVDAAADGFGKQAHKLDYCAQAAVYVDGYHAITGKWLPYRFVVVDKKLPHLVSVYRVTEEQLEQGRELYRSHLDRRAFCLSQNRWPGHNDDEEVDLQLPPWASAGDLDDEDNDLSDTGITFSEEEA